MFSIIFVLFRRRVEMTQSRNIKKLYKVLIMQGFRITKTAKVFLRVFIIRNSFERRECLASSYANISHRLMRRSCTARCECLACLGAKVLHCPMRESRMPRCESLESGDARLSKSPFFLVFLFCPLH